MLRSAFKTIDELKELQPNWDSYGAPVIDLAAREDAKGFLHSVEKTIGPEHADPFVGPTPEGGVVLIWRTSDQRKVEVFFSSEGARFVVLQHRKLLAKGRITPDSASAFIKQYVIAA